MAKKRSNTAMDEFDAGESILTGLREAIAWTQGKPIKVKARTIQVPKVDVKTVREKLHLSQSEFATKFGVTPSTLRNWEQGRRQPEGPARILLAVIDKHPKIVEEVLSAR